MEAAARAYPSKLTHRNIGQAFPCHHERLAASREISPRALCVYSLEAADVHILGNLHGVGAPRGDLGRDES